MNTMISARAFFKGTTTLPTQSKPRAARVVKAVRAEGETETEPAATPAPPPVPKGFCLGMAGSSAPFTDFDPLNLLEGKSVNQIKLYREAELTHGRVSMLGVLGFVVGENFNPLFNCKITGPGINHFQQIPGVFWTALVFAIACAEAYRLTTGWVNPVGEGKEGDETLWTLREGYTPGDLGFDPLGLKPTDAKELMERQTRELNNGRLAMIAIAGIVAQELVTGQKVFAF